MFIGKHGFSPFVLLSGALVLFLCMVGCDNKNLEINPIEPRIQEEIAAITPPLGGPLPGLTASELALFNEGKAAFEAEEEGDEGLGPLFNESGCAVCHSEERSAVGSGSDVVEIRFGKTTNGVFDPLINLGGSLQQLFSIGWTPRCDMDFPEERIPTIANTIARRRTTPLFGLGLVDVLPDQVFINLAASQPAGTRGRANMVFNIKQGKNTVGKFGWKAQVPTLLQFSGDAYVNEMGITTPDFPLEKCPNGPDDCDLVRSCDPVPGLDDDEEDVLLFTAFMRFLAPPPRGRITSQVTAGQTVFNGIGCADCHKPTFTTPNSPSIPYALRNKTFSPYSDFLLHDMGSLGDQIGAQGIAAPREMRTQPLWGNRFEIRLLHDARTPYIEDAIEAHDGQGAAARDAFVRLNDKDHANLIAFVNSL